MEANIERIAFWFFSIISIAAALGVIGNKNPVTAAMCLVMTFLGVAGLFLTLDATFLTAVQILVYAGAIMVLFLFVIMLLNLEHDPLERPGVGRMAGAAVGVALMFVTIAVAKSVKHIEGDSLRDGTGRQVGEVFFSDYLFAFEMASMLLLAAMIGAIVVARRKTTGDLT